VKRTPLQRRTGLKPSGKPLRRTTGLPRSRSALKPFSTRRLAEIPARQRCRLIVLARDPICRGLPGCTRPSVHVHEILFRSGGGDPTDPDGCLGVCAFCHTWIHDHPALSHELGLRKWSWER
jgi:hypothetical protein